MCVFEQGFSQRSFSRGCRVLQKLSIVILMCLLVCGCTSHYTKALVTDVLQDWNMVDTHQLDRRSPWLLHAKTKIYLGRPSDTLLTRDHKLRHIPRTNLQFMQAVEHALAQTFPNVQLDFDTGTHREAILRGREAQCDVLIVPKIAILEDNLNSVHELGEGGHVHDYKVFKPDQIEMTFYMYDVTSGRLLDVASMKSRKGFFARNNDLGILFQSAARAYASQLAAPVL